MTSSLVDPTETWQTRRILKSHTCYRYNVHDVHKHVREVHTCSFLHCVPQEATCGCCGACCFLSVLGQHRNFLIWVAAAQYSSPSLVFSFQIAKTVLNFWWTRTRSQVLVTPLSLFSRVIANYCYPWELKCRAIYSYVLPNTNLPETSNSASC